MNVRQIRKHELPAVLALYVHLHGADEPPPSAEAARTVWDEAMANPRCRYFGGYDGDALVACCTIMVIPNLTRGCRPYAVIENVVTHAAHRNRGWGKAVLAGALAHAWAEGCYKAMLQTGRKDEAVFRFYEGAGFDRHDKQAFVARPKA
ncbi:MAG: GNAT family N-acetyltransferase [Alphaproteobacteria bacterium]|nr:GNAT family N-acetyltransferase [Alphaproteobacteria bacterium]